MTDSLISVLNVGRRLLFLKGVAGCAGYVVIAGAADNWYIPTAEGVVD